MRKRSKLVALLVAMVFMLSLVGTASATNFSDIANSEFKSSIMKLNALGVIDGYPDGTFQPDGKITRAEFAKFAVVIAGLKDAAEGMSDVKSPFSDVAAGEWYTGWVNVAAAQGYVKGFEGMFRPNDNITQQEVITVLLRLLGYNDNLAGEWPFDYLAKATKLGILDDVKLAAALPATRGLVAKLSDEVISQNTVDYKASDNVFEEKAKTLMQESFKDAELLEDVFINNLNCKDNKVKLVEAVTGTDEFEIDPGYTIFGAANYNGAREQYCDLIRAKNKDGDMVVKYIEVKKYGAVTNDEITLTAKITAVSGDPATVSAYTVTKLEVNDKSYDVITDCLFAGVAPSFTWDSVAVGKTGTWSDADDCDFYKVIFDEDGKVAAIKKYAVKKAAIVDSVDTARKVVRLKDKGVGSYAFASSKIDLVEYDKDYFVMKNGAPASFEDLKENDIVYNTKRGVTNYFDAVDKKVSGTLEGVVEDGEDVILTVGGQDYKLQMDYSGDGAFAAMISTDGGDSVSNITDIEDLYDYIDNNVTLCLNLIGKVSLVITDEEAEGTKMYGIVNEVIRDNINGDFVKILTKEGTVVKYEINKDSDTTAKGFRDAFDEGKKTTNVDTFVQYTLQSDGSIDKLTDLWDPSDDTQIASDVETGRIQVGTTWYQVKSSVVVFNTADPDDDEYSSVEAYSDLYDAVDDSGDVEVVIHLNSDGIIDYIVAVDAELGGGDFFMVMGKGKDANGWYVNLDRNGTTTKYTCKNEPTAVTKKDVVKINKSGSEITSFDFTNGFDYSPATVNKAVYDVDTSNSRIKIEGIWYSVDEDTIIYEVDETNPIARELADVAKDDQVAFYPEDGLIKWLVFAND